jgi:hypothetical protein
MYLQLHAYVPGNPSIRPSTELCSDVIKNVAVRGHALHAGKQGDRRSEDPQASTPFLGQAFAPLTTWGSEQELTDADIPL